MSTPIYKDSNLSSAQLLWPIWESPCYFFGWTNMYPSETRGEDEHNQHPGQLQTLNELSPAGHCDSVCDAASQNITPCFNATTNSFTPSITTKQPKTAKWKLLNKPLALQMSCLMLAPSSFSPSPCRFSTVWFSSACLEEGELECRKISFAALLLNL